MFDGLAIRVRQMVESPEESRHLAVADVVHACAKLGENGNCGQPGQPRPVRLHLLVDQPLGARKLATAMIDRGHHELPEVVQVVEVHVLERPDRGIDVARQRDVENAQGPITSRRQARRDVRRRHDGVRRRGRAQHHIDVGEA
jgi:hypothetical protein